MNRTSRSSIYDHCDRTMGAKKNVVNVRLQAMFAQGLIVLYYDGRYKITAKGKEVLRKARIARALSEAQKVAIKERLASINDPYVSMAQLNTDWLYLCGVALMTTGYSDSLNGFQELQSIVG